MKRFFFSILLFSTISYGQIKLYPKAGSAVRAKATVLELEKIPHLKEGEKEALVAAGTVFATLAPFAIDYGLELVTSLTERKEADYSSEILAQNILKIDFDSLVKYKTDIFKSSLKYYERGSNKDSVAATYNFKVDMSKEETLVLSLENCNETLIPVKARKRKDFIFESFEFTLTADITQKKDSNMVRSKINLGTAKIHRQIISFKDGEVRSKEINPVEFIMSKYDDKGKLRNIKTLYLTLKLTYLNPYGLTTNTFNSYLENSKDNTSSLLKEILVGSDD